MFRLHAYLPKPFPQGTLPKLTAKSNCRYEVEWVTEYACHREYLESSNCSLSSAQHDVAIDLGPLRQARGERRGGGWPGLGLGAAAGAGGVGERGPGRGSGVRLPPAALAPGPGSCAPPPQAGTLRMGRSTFFI